jgi:hypothetical protein
MLPDDAALARKFNGWTMAHELSAQIIEMTDAVRLTLGAAHGAKPSTLKPVRIPRPEPWAPEVRVQPAKRPASTMEVAALFNSALGR